MNSIAPTSTPRVGWAAMMTSGSPESSRARMAFCWLPPESERALASGSGGLTSYALRFSAARRRMTFGKIQPHRELGGSS